MTYQAPGLRERAYSAGLGALADVETLELYLSRSLERGAQTFAQVLIGRFQTLSGVLAADLDTLAAVVGRPAAVDLKLLHETTRRLLEAPLRKRDVLSSWSALCAYLKHDLAERRREQFRVLFLDKKNQLIADVQMNEGTVDHASVYPREVIRKALEFEVSAMILVHNHPSGDPTPSQADIEMTRQIVDTAKGLKITVHDHIIVGADGLASFRALGLM